MSVPAGGSDASQLSSQRRIKDQTASVDARTDERAEQRRAVPLLNQRLYLRERNTGAVESYSDDNRRYVVPVLLERLLKNP